MRRSLLIIAMVTSVWSAFGQEQTDRAKYELIRETINFLATDKVVSRDTNFRISCETLDYDCFKQQLSGQPIAGIERWYNSWRSMTVADEAGLVALRNQVFADIFERPGKGYRKQLIGYEAYVSRTEQLIDPYADYPPPVETSVDTASLPVATPAELNEPAAEQLGTPTDTPEKNNTMIAYFALALGLIALIVAARPIFGKKEPQQQPVDSQLLLERLDELAVRIERLERTMADNQQIKDATGSLTEIMEAIESRVVALEKNTKQP